MGEVASGSGSAGGTCVGWSNSSAVYSTGGKRRWRFTWPRNQQHDLWGCQRFADTDTRNLDWANTTRPTPHPSPCPHCSIPKDPSTLCARDNCGVLIQTFKHCTFPLPSRTAPTACITDTHPAGLLSVTMAVTPLPTPAASPLWRCSYRHMYSYPTHPGFLDPTTMPPSTILIVCFLPCLQPPLSPDTVLRPLLSGKSLPTFMFATLAFYIISVLIWH